MNWEKKKEQQNPEIPHVKTGNILGGKRHRESPNLGGRNGGGVDWAFGGVGFEMAEICGVEKTGCVILGGGGVKRRIFMKQKSPNQLCWLRVDNNKTKPRPVAFDSLPYPRTLEAVIMQRPSQEYCMFEMESE